MSLMRAMATRRKKKERKKNRRKEKEFACLFGCFLFFFLEMFNKSKAIKNTNTLARHLKTEWEGIWKTWNN